MRTQEQRQFHIVLHHEGRNCLATTLISFGTLGVLTSWALIAVGITIHAVVDPYRIILDDYDGAYLSFILGGLGLTGTVVHGLLIFLLVEFTRADRAEHFGRVCLALAVCAALTLAAGITCFVHIREIDSAFRGGLTVGMKSYMNNTQQKAAVDELQMQYQCCGLKSYKDWFNISWIDEKFVEKSKREKKIKNGVYLPDDVPFSCCNAAVLRPCIHEAVHTNNQHFNYDYVRNVTIHTDGCFEKLRKFFGPGLLFIMGTLVCCIAFMDFCIAAGTRLLYTSLLSANKKGDEFGPGIGILWPGRILVVHSSTDMRK